MASTRGYEDPLDLYEDLEDMPSSRAIDRLRRQALTSRKPAQAQKSASPPAAIQLTNESDDFNFTYRAGRYEATWLYQSLGEFYDQQWFDDVLQLVKGGKEASVYLCQGNETTGEEHLAAKVYRPRRFRSLKNDHLYREGRDNLDANGHIVTDDGTLHAMRKKTQFGLEALHTSWIEYEVRTLHILHAAGADVPTPFASAGNAILMSYLGSGEMAAPALIDVELSATEARPLFERSLWNIEVMLRNRRVHGDLSAYNILYWQGEITLIDFPQAMDPEQSHNTFRVFERDVVRVCEYFQTYGLRSQPRKLAADLWQAYHHRTAPEIDPHYLDDQSDSDRSLWRDLTGR